MAKDSHGATLVTVLVILVLAFVVWAILNPMREPGREASYRVAAKSDLKNFLTAQEAHFADSGRYYAGPVIDPAFVRYFVGSPGVTIALTTASDSGFAAIAVHEGVPDLLCRVYVGATRPVTLSDEQQEGEVVCKRAR